MKANDLRKLAGLCREYDAATDSSIRRALGNEIDSYGERMSEREIREFTDEYGKNEPD